MYGTCTWKCIVFFCSKFSIGIYSIYGVRNEILCIPVQVPNGNL